MTHPKEVLPVTNTGTPGPRRVNVIHPVNNPQEDLPMTSTGPPGYHDLIMLSSNERPAGGFTNNLQMEHPGRCAIV